VSKQTGDRFERLAVLTQILAGMFSNIHEDIKCFSYIYTKFSKEDIPSLKSTLMNISKSISKKDDEEIDKSFKLFIDDMTKKQRKNLIILNPLIDDPKTVIKQLVDEEFISNPGRRMNISLSEKSKFKLDSQMQKHFSFIEKSIQRSEYELAMFKLYEVIQLKSIVSDRKVNEKFNELSTTLIDKLNRKFSDCIDSFNKKINRKELLNENDMDNYFKCLDSASKSKIIFEKLDTSINKFDLLQENLLKVFQNTKEKLNIEFKITDDYEELKVSLDNLKLIAYNKEFKEESTNIFKSNYNDILNTIKTKIVNHVDTLNEGLFSNKFQSIVCNLSVLKMMGDQFANHFVLNDYEEAKKKIASEIEKRSKKCNHMLKINEIDDNAMQCLKENFDYFVAAIYDFKIHQHIELSLIESNYNKFKYSISQFFEKHVSAINLELEELNSQNKTKFQISKNSFNEMKKLMQIHEIEILNRTLFNEALNKIKHLVEKMKSEIDRIICLIVNQPKGEDYDQLANCLKNLEKLAWVEEHEKNTFSLLKNEIGDTLLQNIKRLSSCLKSAKFGIENTNQLLKNYEIFKAITYNETLAEMYTCLNEIINESKSWFLEQIKKQFKSIINYLKAGSNLKIDYNSAEKAIAYILICKEFREVTFYLKEDLEAADHALKTVISERISFILNESKNTFESMEKSNSKNKEENISKASLLCRLLIEIENTSDFENVMSFFPAEFSCTDFLSECRAFLSQTYKTLQIEIKDNSEKRLTEKLTIAKVFCKLEPFWGEEKFTNILEEYSMIAKLESKEIFSNGKSLIKNLNDFEELANCFNKLKTADQTDQFYFENLKTRLDSRMKKIMRYTKLKANTLDDLEESNLKLIQENLELVFDAKEFLNEYLPEYIDSFEVEIKEIVTKFVSLYLENIIKLIPLFGAEAKISHIIRMRLYLSYLVNNQSILDKITVLRDLQNKLIFDTIQDFKKFDLKTYYFNSPKEIFDKFSNLDHITKNEAKINFKKILTEKYNEELEKMIQHNPLNLNFEHIERSLNFLPNDFKAMIEYDYIEKKRKEIKNNIKEEEERIKLSIAEKYFDKIKSQYEYYQEHNQKENMKRIEEFIVITYDLQYSRFKEDFNKNSETVEKSLQILVNLDETFSCNLKEIKQKHEICSKFVSDHFKEAKNNLNSVLNFFNEENKPLKLNSEEIERSFNFIFTISKINQKNQIYKIEFQSINSNLRDILKKFQNNFQAAIDTYDVKTLTESLKLMKTLSCISGKCLESESKKISFQDMVKMCEKKIQSLFDYLKNIHFIQYKSGEMHHEKKFNEFFVSLNLKFALLNKLIGLIENDSDNQNLHSLESESFKSLEDKISNLFDDLMDKLENILNETCENSDVDEFLSSYFNVSAFNKSMDPKFKKPISFKADCKNKLFTKIEDISKYISDSTNSDLQHTVDSLISIRNFSNKIFFFKKNVDEKLSLILKSIFKKSGNFNLIAKLAQSLKTDPIGSLIVSEHKCFEAFHRSLFNRKTLSQDIKYVLENIKGDELDEKKLENDFSVFNSVYEKLLVEYLQPKIKFEKFISNLRLITNKVKVGNSSKLKWDLYIREKIPEVVAYIFALWTLLNAGSYFESKNERNFLFLPHPSQVISIFRLLGLGYKQKFLDKFLDFTGLLASESLHNNLIQIGTGEGKSVTLAVTAAVLSLFGYEVYCVCYSDYLSKRDYATFELLFDKLNILDRVSYGTFQTMCEKVINKNQDIRTAVKNIILNNNLPSLRYASSEQPCVLLIDEVDVFFSQSFYGKSYNPIVFINDEKIHTLIRYLWSKRKYNLELVSLKSTNEYNECIKKFKQWTKLIDKACQQMIDDLKTFESHKYEVKDDKIGYKYYDKIEFNTFHGYKTLFAYFLEHEKELISKSSLEKNLNIHVNVGSFSYAQIPIENFSAILGVTGTLETLNDTQKSIIQDTYNIKHKTLAPSIYGRNNMRFDPIQNVQVESEANHFKVIVHQINQRMVGQNVGTKRAIFVVFESTNELKQFYDSEEFIPHKWNCGILTEEISSDEKVNIINKSTISGRITLFNKEFGRGTDFIVHDEILSANGGVHLIQTFLSENYSEELQIRGRVARQGENGSYSLIISDKSLKKFKIDNANEISHSLLYNVLNEKQQTFFNKQYDEQIKNVSSIEQKHKESLAFIKSLELGDSMAIKKFLIENI